MPARRRRLTSCAQTARTSLSASPTSAWTKESAPNRSTDLYANVTGLDFIIDGHSHTVMVEGANGEPIQSTGTAFEYVGMILIDSESKEILGNALVELGRAWRRSHRGRRCTEDHRSRQRRVR